MKKFLPHTLILGSAILSVNAQQTTDDAPLAANPEVDSYAIADQLYAQARTPGLAAADRRNTMLRAAVLFGEFAARYPKSAKIAQAQYLQAVCLAEAGDAVASNKVLQTLADTGKGEYAAAAAYRLAILAVERHQWEKARNLFRITQRESKRADLRNDSLYRLGRTQLQMGQRREAESSFNQLLVLESVQPAILHSCVMALAQMKIEDGKDAEAYALLRRLLSMQGVDTALRSAATLQAARLASRLEKGAEARQYYAELAAMPGMDKYAGEAQMESIMTLYKNKDYEGVVKQAGQSVAKLSDPVAEARFALIVGQSYMELKQYDKAVKMFAEVEAVQPETRLAADAAYRSIICARQMNSVKFLAMAQKYLSTYAVPGKPTADMPSNDLVRLMYADRTMQVDVADAARQFDAINFENLPESVRPDAEYKKAWCAAQGESYDAVPTLDLFIETYKQDARLPEALALRGACLIKQNKTGQALADFDRVIKEFPQSAAVPVCWQQAARACSGTDPKKMVYYYEGLIACGSRVKPSARAEAHYAIARALYDTDPAAAIPHFSEARTINPEDYGSRVELGLVQCYFKMQDDENLRSSLRELESHNPASYKALPPAILRWCGWSCFRKQRYQEADKYLTDALSREPVEKYTAADGSEKTRPKVEPLVWKTLARARLEQEQYQRGLEAAEFYVAAESQPYRKAEGMRDMAELLIGLNRTAEARKLCEDAIALGIDGPIKSSVFIALGDSYYVEGNYAEAAKYYGRTANVVSDKDLKPIALYKIEAALRRSGREGEASQYAENLRSEFKGWVPSARVAKLVEQSDKKPQ